MALSRIQSTGNEAAGTTVTTAISTPTVGNLLVASVEVLGNIANITPPTGFGATPVVSAANGTSNGVAIYSRVADGTEGTSLSASCAGASTIALTLAEYNSTNGAFTSAAADQTNGGNAASGTSIGTGAITPSGASFVLVSAQDTKSGSTTGMAASGMTIQESLRGTRDNYADALVSGGSGSYSSTWSWSSSVNQGCAAAIANFLEPSGGSTPVSNTAGGSLEATAGVVATA